MANTIKKNQKLIIVVCNSEYYQEWDSFCFEHKIKNRSEFLRLMIKEQMQKNIQTDNNTYLI